MYVFSVYLYMRSLSVYRYISRYAETQGVVSCVLYIPIYVFFIYLCMCSLDMPIYVWVADGTAHPHTQSCLKTEVSRGGGEVRVVTCRRAGPKLTQKESL